MSSPWLPPSSPPLGPPEPPAAPPPPPAPPGTLRASAGPTALLFGLGVAIIMSSTFKRQMGDVSCAWRVPYAPAGRAMAIWGIIFGWLMASCIGQLGVSMGFDNVYAAEPWNNMLVGLALFGAGLWVLAFGCARREDNRGGLVISASFLVSSTWCALGACTQELSWRGLDWVRIVWVGAPFALFAGWMYVASSLGVGVAWMAMRYPPDYRCFREAKPDSGVWTDEDAGPSRSCASWVPLLLSAPLCVAAVVLPDPVLPLPLAWAIVNTKGHSKSRLALALLVASSVSAVIVAYLEAWPV